LVFSSAAKVVVCGRDGLLPGAIEHLQRWETLLRRIVEMLEDRWLRFSAPDGGVKLAVDLRTAKWSPGGRTQKPMDDRYWRKDLC